MCLAQSYHSGKASNIVSIKLFIGIKKLRNRATQTRKCASAVVMPAVTAYHPMKNYQHFGV